MPQGIGITCKKRGRVMQMVAVACAEDEIRRTVGYFQPESRPGRPCGSESFNVRNSCGAAREHYAKAGGAIKQASGGANCVSGLLCRRGLRYLVHVEDLSESCRNCRPSCLPQSRAVSFLGPEGRRARSR